jgi:carbon monoxide dehydrogenase subunit G
VNASFQSTIEINNVIEEESYEIIAQGNAGQLGNASGKVIIFLKELDKTTVLDYEADTRINGRIAQLGSRLIDGSVKKNTDLFFQNFSKILNEDSNIIFNGKKNNIIIKKVKVLICLILLFLIILFIGFYVS